MTMTSRWSFVLIAVLLAQAAGVRADSAPPLKVSIIYLSREETSAPRASLLEPAAARFGEDGAEFGLQEINNSGRFLNIRYELMKVVVPRDVDIAATVRKTLA